MNKLDRYKKTFSVENDLESMSIDPSGKVHIPVWLSKLLIHTSGLTSRKKRVLKKRLKREVMKLIQSHLLEDKSEP